jgi:hypothetical protein
MEAKAIESGNETISVAKRDLIEAWSVLEKVVVSLRRMGSHYATPGPDVPLPPEHQQQMLKDLDAYFSPELVRELGRARRLLVEYLPEDETEHLSEHVLKYWNAKEDGQPT